MKMNCKRILAAGLALLMTATLTVSCDSNDEKKGDISGIKNDVNTPTELTLEVPALNYGDTPLTVLSYEAYADLNNDENSTPLARALYEQYASAGDYLGIDFEVMKASAYPEVPNMVIQSVNSGSDDYQIVCGVANNIGGLVYEGYFLPVSELTHVNFDKTWWNGGYSKSVAVNENEPYVLFGDICYGSIERSAAVFFNKRILEEVHHLEDTDLYDLVLDGK